MKYGMLYPMRTMIIAGLIAVSLTVHADDYYSMSGEITYNAGSYNGTLYVQLYPYINPPLDYEDLIPGFSSGVVAWAVSNIYKPDTPNFDLIAFLDTNGDGKRDTWEPVGQHEFNPWGPIGSGFGGCSDCDIAITNPPLVDTDGDSLLDVDEEFIYGSSWQFADTDNDGLDDGQEILIYSTRWDLVDSDWDGLSDSNEVFVTGTDPNNADMDADGLNDYEEVITYGTNPTNVDTDADGLVDGVEVYGWGSNPLLPDSDFDGINDVDETQNGFVLYGWRSNPMNPDSDGDGMSDYDEMVVTRHCPTNANEFFMVHVEEPKTINLLNNPSFETTGSDATKAQYWEFGNPNNNGTTWGAASRESWQGYEGAWEGVIKATWAGDGDNGGFWQEVPATTGLQYTFSAKFWADDGTPFGPWTSSDMGMNIEFFNGANGGSNMIGAVTSKISGIVQEWTERHVSGIAPAGATWVRVVIYAFGNGADGALQFDDLSLTELAPDTHFSLNWDSTTGRTYEVMSNGDLMSGWVLKKSYNGTGTSMSHNVSCDIAGCSYMVKVHLTE